MQAPETPQSTDPSIVSLYKHPRPRTRLTRILFIAVSSLGAGLLRCSLAAPAVVVLHQVGLRAVAVVTLVIRVTRVTTSRSQHYLVIAKKLVLSTTTW